MTNIQPTSHDLADAFHSAFVATYVTLARRKHPRYAIHFPFHGQDVHVIHGGNRWWHILCIPGQYHGDARLGPIGRYTVQAVDATTHPDLASLPDETTARKEEFRLTVGADLCLYHEAFAPPGPPDAATLADMATNLARRLVDEHSARFVELEALKAKAASLRNANQIALDLNEAVACLLSGHERAAIVLLCSAAEAAIVGRLEELGHPIRQEERGRVLGHEHHSFTVMVAELYRRNATQAKTRERLDVLNGLRRGTEHCQPDATLHDDAVFTWITLQLLLNDLARSTKG